MDDVICWVWKYRCRSRFRVNNEFSFWDVELEEYLYLWLSVNSLWKPRKSRRCWASQRREAGGGDWGENKERGAPGGQCGKSPRKWESKWEIRPCAQRPNWSNKESESVSWVWWGPKYNSNVLKKKEREENGSSEWRPRRVGNSCGQREQDGNVCIWETMEVMVVFFLLFLFGGDTTQSRAMYMMKGQKEGIAREKWEKRQKWWGSACEWGGGEIGSQAALGMAPGEEPEEENGP